MKPAKARLATPFPAIAHPRIEGGRCLWFCLRMIYSNDPRDYTREHLERALLTIAEMIVDQAAPHWAYLAIEEALALHQGDDVQDRARQLVARMKPPGP